LVGFFQQKVWGKFFGIPIKNSEKKKLENFCQIFDIKKLKKKGRKKKKEP
jgi:hypothetical protein